MTRDRRLGWLAILAGATLALAVQTAGPVGVPLYDGVQVAEPYRYLHPVGNQAGLPSSFNSTQAVAGGVSPAFAAATSEQPPQAQLIAQVGAFVLSPGATALHVSITPIEAPEPPAGTTIAGNVYRILVTDQAGTTLAIASCDGCISLSMRAPDGTGDGTIRRSVNGTWAELQTLPVGIVSMFQTNPTALGDLAVIVPGSPAAASGPGASGAYGPLVIPTTPGLDPLVVFGVGALVLWLVVFGIVVWSRIRPLPAPGGAAGKPRSRTPATQKPPKRPRSGRSDT